MEQGDDSGSEWGELLMSNYLATGSELTAVADAIRAKGGVSGQLVFPAGFVSAIGDIDTQPPLGTAAATPTKQTQTITPGQGEYGLSQVTVNPIPAQYVDTADATATADDIGSGKTAYVNGSKVTGTGDILMISADIIADYYPVISGACGSLTIVGTSVALDATAQFQVWFSNWQSSYTATVKDSQNNSYPVSYLTSGNYKLVCVDVVSKKLPEKFTVTVTDGTNSYVIIAGPFSYVRSVLANNNPKKQKEMVASMYWYGIKTKAFFG